VPSGDLVVADDDGVLARVHDGTKTPVAAGTPFASTWSTRTTAR